MANKTFRAAQSDFDQSATLIDGTEPIPFTGTDNADYAASFAEHSTGAGYPPLDVNGDMQAQVILRTDTIENLRGASDGELGEIAVPSDIDGILVYLVAGSSTYIPRGSQIVYNGGYPIPPQGDSIVPLTTNVAYPISIINTSEDQFDIPGYMRSLQTISVGKVTLAVNAYVQVPEAGSEITVWVDGTTNGTDWNPLNTADRFRIKGTEDSGFLTLSGTETYVISGSFLRNLLGLRIMTNYTGGTAPVGIEAGSSVILQYDISGR